MAVSPAMPSVGKCARMVSARDHDRDEILAILGSIKAIAEKVDNLR